MQTEEICNFKCKVSYKIQAFNCLFSGRKTQLYKALAKGLAENTTVTLRNTGPHKAQFDNVGPGI